MKLFDRGATDLLRQTSRTFFVPIIRLPSDLRSAVGSAYLCMRGVDEIEDHEELSPDEVSELLEQVSSILQAAETEQDLVALTDLLHPFGQRLPEVTHKLGRHAALAPDAVARTVWRSTSDMAQRMAHWARGNWQVHTEEDLDDYTFDVAGRVGLLLTELWQWYDGTMADRELAVGYGRGLQAVNIIRNRHEDEGRGVSFYPDGWTAKDMHAYAQRHLAMGDAYLQSLPAGPARDFCNVPLALAYATLEAILAGKGKMTRDSVIQLIEKCTGVRHADEIRVGD